MVAPTEIVDDARASPSGDARRPRPIDVGSEQGLPAQGRSRMKKLVPNIRCATINIGTLVGRSRELADILWKHRVDIACVQETKWKGSKAKEIGDEFKLYYHGTSTKRNGVGIIISRRLQDNITEVNRVSDRIMSIKIDTGSKILRVVSCYGPQSNLLDCEKDDFWESLDAHLVQFGQEEHILLGGDLNGHVGEMRDSYDRIHGGNGFGQRNPDGIRILDFAEAHDLAVVNTLFKKHHSHLITYESGVHLSQLDYWLIRRSDWRLVTNAKVIPSEVISPQHHPLIMDIRIEVKTRRPRTTNAERIKWGKIRECWDELTMALNAIEVDLDQPANTIWTNLVKAITSTAAMILGTTKPGRRYIDKQPWWWNDVVKEVVAAKKAAYKEWRQTHTPEDFQNYRSLKSAAKTAVAKAKSLHYDDLYTCLDTPEGQNDIYRLAAARHRSMLDISHMMNIKDSDHHILRDPAAILR